jgi:hypothetical protein
MTVLSKFTSVASDIRIEYISYYVAGIASLVRLIKLESKAVFRITESYSTFSNWF